MREPISLKEILAVLVKRGWGILITAAAVAIVLGGLQFKKQVDYSKLPENSASQIEEEYQAAVVQRNEELEALKETLEHTEILLDRQKTYNDKSVLLKIDSYNAPKNITVFSIDLLETDGDGERSDQSEDRYDRMIAQLQYIYDTYWNVADLREEFKEYGFGHMEDMYIRELISFGPTKGGTITVLVWGESVADVERLADAVSKWMMRLSVSEETDAYEHRLSVLKGATKIEVSDEVKNQQDYHNESEADLENEVKRLKDEIENLAMPERRPGYSMKEILTATLKWVILGFVIGGILGCAWVLVLYLFQSRVESSRQMEQVLGIPFLGSVAKKGDIFHCLADMMLAERVWKDPAEAEEYVTKSLQAAAGETDGVLILTTLKDKHVGSALTSVEKAVLPAGGKACFIKDAEKNPQTVEALQTCKCVVLAERTGASEVPQMLGLLELAKRMDAKVVGFVTI